MMSESLHSCKCTVLSYAAKRGLPHDERLVLGHHAHQGRMADVYARDAEARPLSDGGPFERDKTEEIFSR